MRKEATLKMETVESMVHTIMEDEAARWTVRSRG
jgi:hypothetical protein